MRIKRNTLRRIINEVIQKSLNEMGWEDHEAMNLNLPPLDDENFPMGTDINDYFSEEDTDGDGEIDRYREDLGDHNKDGVPDMVQVRQHLINQGKTQDLEADSLPWDKIAGIAGGAAGAAALGMAAKKKKKK